MSTGQCVERHQKRASVSQQKYRNKLNSCARGKIRKYDRERKRRKKLEATNYAQRLRREARIRQIATRVRQHMPTNSEDYQLVVHHLFKNCKSYMKKLKKNENSSSHSNEELQQPASEESASVSKHQQCKDLNKKLRIIKMLKNRNRLREHNEHVNRLKKEYGTFKNISDISGARYNYVRWVCKKPELKLHKSSVLCTKRKNLVRSFLMLETVSFSSPCQRYANKKFLLDTLDKTYEKFKEHPQFHTFGLVAKSTMKSYRPKYILLANRIPLHQCLCNYCENLQLITSALIKFGLKGNSRK